MPHHPWPPVQLGGGPGRPHSRSPTPCGAAGVSCAAVPRGSFRPAPPVPRRPAAVLGAPRVVGFSRPGGTRWAAHLARPAARGARPAAAAPARVRGPPGSPFNAHNPYRESGRPRDFLRAPRQGQGAVFPAAAAARAAGGGSGGGSSPAELLRTAGPKLGARRARDRPAKPGQQLPGGPRACARDYASAARAQPQRKNTVVSAKIGHRRGGPCSARLAAFA